jgi:hypothetical protein
MVTMAILDHLMEIAQKPLLIECDTSNPDVWKAYKEKVPSQLINLDESDGWIELVNVCDSNRDEAVMIKTAARNNSSARRAWGRDRVFFEVDSSESVLVNPFAFDVMPESLSGARRKRATDLKRGGHAYVATPPELRANP